MLLLKKWNIPVIVALLLLVGCNNQKTTDDNLKSRQPAPNDKQCFKYSDDILDLKVTLRIDEQNNVKGFQSGVITNDAVGYYTSYTSTFTGKLEGNILKVKVITKIENDTQETDQEWKLEGDKLYNRANTLTRTECN